MTNLKFTDRQDPSLMIGELSATVTASSYLFISSGSSKPIIKDLDELLKLIPDVSKASLGLAEKVASSVPPRWDYVDPMSVFNGHRYLPYIPGSSLKGAIRSRVEMLLSSSCFRVGYQPLREPPRHGHGWRHAKIWKPEGVSVAVVRRPPPCDLNRSEDVCPVCDVFGAPGLASRVLFGSFMPVDFQLDDLDLDHNERVKAVKQGSVFRGSIHFSLKLQELGLLFIGMRLHEDRPILLGKSKYRLRLRLPSREQVVFGRAKIGLDAIKLARIPQGSMDERARRLFEVYYDNGIRYLIDRAKHGEKLDEFVESAVSKAKEFYGRQLVVNYDEVSRLEELSKA